jgi:Ca2+/Na+ antiporter
VPYPSQALLLGAFGALFALLFLLITLIKTITHRDKVVFLDLLLAFLATLLTVLALAYYAMEPSQRVAVVQTLALGLGLVLAVFGVLVLVVELRRSTNLRGSRGVLGIWMGVLMVASTFTIPRVADRLLSPTPTAVVQSAGDEPAAQAATEEIQTEPPATPAPPPVATNTQPAATPQPTQAAATQMPTRTPRPTHTPTMTRTPFRYSTRTPEPSPTYVASCEGTMGYNLRLRAAPDENSETLATIPFDAVLQIHGRSEDGAWLYVTHENQVGWVSAQYVTVNAVCGDLPVQPAN